MRKKLVLIVSFLIILFIIIIFLLIRKNSKIITPEKLCYNITSDEIILQDIELGNNKKISNKKKIITDKDEINKILELFNDGLSADIYLCEHMYNLKITFNENVVIYSSDDGFGSIISGESERRILISKEALEYVNKKLEE